MKEFIINKYNRPVVPKLPDEVIQAINDSKTPEIKMWEESRRRILSTLDENEVQGVNEWNNAIISAAKSIDKVEANSWYLFAPSEILVHDIIRLRMDSKGIDYFVSFLKRNPVMTFNLLKYSRTLHIYRQMTKELIINKDLDTIQYLFSINPDNKYYRNTFAEIVVDSLKTMQKRPALHYEDVFLLFSELSPDLLDYFLNFSDLYLDGLQKARFDLYCIYYFKLGLKERIKC